MTKIPFHRAYATGNELAYLEDVIQGGHFSGDGPFTKQCHNWLNQNVARHASLLTHSCTAALEMTSLLLDICPGDEVIMPSYTFVSTANAFALRGGVPVFVDIREDTLNVDERLLEQAITPKTKAIVVVHYAGVACEMDTIMALAQEHQVRVIEDAAQGIMSSYKGKPLGSIGDFGTISFHGTKNIVSGEGGALIINNAEYMTRAEVLREKGTDRSQFIRGDIDKYTWRDIGSSYLPGELISAFLFAQLESSQNITQKRYTLWERYHRMLAPYEERGLIRRPVVPIHCEHNAHMYFIILPQGVSRSVVIEGLAKEGVQLVTHYEPLHSSPCGEKLCRKSGALEKTNSYASRILRLPMWVGLSELQQQEVVDKLITALCR